MSKIRNIFTQAQDFLADIQSRNKLYHDLVFEVIEQTLSDEKTPPKEAIVLKTFPQNSTGADLKDGKEQYQSAILRVDSLHDSLPDPARIYRTATIGECNKAISAHLLCFSVEPFDSTDSSQNTSIVLKPGQIVPIEFIDGVVRFGVPRGEHPDYLGFNPSEAREDQARKPTKEEIQKAFEKNKSALLGTFVGPPAPGDTSKVEVAIYKKTGEYINNGSMPSNLLKTWPDQAKENLAGGDVMFLADVYDNFVLLATDFETHFGYPIIINDSYRSYKEQVAMKVKKTNQGKPNQAATPGTSNHGWGVAFDYSTWDGTKGKFAGAHYKWLYENAPKRGFHSPPWAQEGSRNAESWHFEWKSKAELITILKETTKEGAE